jgi:hypothetical protein
MDTKSNKIFRAYLQTKNSDLEKIKLAKHSENASKKYIETVHVLGAGQITKKIEL